MAYYSEEIVKNTKEREEYREGVERFLDEAIKKANAARAEYITPKKLLADPEYYRGEFVKLLGYPLTEKLTAPRLIRKDFVAEDGNVNIYRMQLEFFGHLKTYGIYFEQRENAKDAPFVISLHGGAGTPELVSSIYNNSANYNHQTRRVTDRGANVFAPLLLLWHKETYGNEYNREYLDGRLRMMGGSMTALEIYLLMGAISYFIEKENINAERIGAIGLSYGGMYAQYLTATDTRVKATYASSYFNDLYKNPRPDWCYHGSAFKFNCAEIAALAIPRALCVSVGDKDPMFDPTDTAAAGKRAAEFYAEAGVHDKFLGDIFDGVHELNRLDVGIDFLIKNL